MVRLSVFKNKNRRGLPPGEAVFTGQKKVDEIKIHYLEYNSTDLKDDLVDNQSIASYHERNDQVMQWYDVRGLHDTKVIEDIGSIFKVHSLVLEDIVDVNQRPKCDQYDEGIFMCFKSLAWQDEADQVEFEHLSLYFGDGFLLSFQERSSDLFVDVRNRIHRGLGRVRSRGADYLAYALLDAVVDRYFDVIERIEGRIEALEYEVNNHPADSTKARIHGLKNETIRVRKAIGPLREATSTLYKSEHDLVDEKTKLFIRDVYDHIIQLMDLVETYRDLLSGLQDLYLSEISFRMNKVIQVLTIVTTIFVPLSFLAGLYGMNFEYMPELKYRYGYPILIGIMALLGLGALLFFKKKKWL